MFVLGNLPKEIAEIYCFLFAATSFKYSGSPPVALSRPCFGHHGLSIYISLGQGSAMRIRLLLLIGPMISVERVHLVLKIARGASITPIGHRVLF